jgi:hypothetical protein
MCSNAKGPDMDFLNVLSDLPFEGWNLCFVFGKTPITILIRRRTILCEFS